MSARDVAPLCDASVGWWLAGFVDGEGCFFIARSGACSFHIKLRADDRELLERIRATIGHGRVVEKPRTSATRHPQLHYVVSNKAGCLAIVDLFADFPLRSKKRRDFATWSAAVELWNIGGGRSDEMTALRRQLREGRVYHVEAA